MFYNQIIILYITYAVFDCVIGIMLPPAKGTNTHRHTDTNIPKKIKHFFLHLFAKTENGEGCKVVETPETFFWKQLKMVKVVKLWKHLPRGK